MLIFQGVSGVNFTIIVPQKTPLNSHETCLERVILEEDQLLPSDLVIIQRRSRFTPEKVTNKTPKRVTRKNLGVAFRTKKAVTFFRDH